MARIPIETKPFCNLAPGHRGEERLKKKPGVAYSQKLDWVRIATGLAAIGGLITLSLVLLRPSSLPPVPVREPAGVLELAYGSVVVQSVRGARIAASRPPGVVGQRVFSGAVIDTRASGTRQVPGRAAFRLVGGSLMRLDADTVVRFRSVSALVLERGAIYIDSSEAVSDVESPKPLA